ncbi:MAG TPA: cysteine rich repeat-containing protein [Nitrospira sp.]|nr:cysteine rich repeat-containing protein [Nitrospira sp.]
MTMRHDWKAGGAALFVGAVLLFVSGPVAAADPPPQATTPAPGSAEQSPEQAAGGREGLKRMRQACETDVKQFCHDVRPGGGRIIQCLRKHDAELSQGCRQAVEPGRQK